MNTDHPAPTAFGAYGWLVLLAACVAVIVRLIKADALNATLARLSIPPIPKAWLSWIALALGFMGGAAQAKIGGAGWSDAALAGGWGVLGGGSAVAANETLAGLLRSVSPGIADVVFGRNAGPTLTSVAPTPAPPGSVAEAREVKAAAQVVLAAPPPVVVDAVAAVESESQRPPPPSPPIPPIVMLVMVATLTVSCAAHGDSASARAVVRVGSVGVDVRPYDGEAPDGALLMGLGVALFISAIMFALYTRRNQEGSSR